GVVGAAVVGGLGADFAYGKRLFSILELQQVADTWLAVIVGAAFVGGARVAVRVRRQRTSVFVAMTGVYLVVVALDTWVKPFDGYPLRAFADVAFVFVVAAMSILEFGVLQVRVGDLERHGDRLVGLLRRFLGDAVAEKLVAGSGATEERAVVAMFIDIR